MDRRRLLHTWVDSPFSRAQSPWKEPPVGLGGCVCVRTPDRGRTLEQASHFHRCEKAPGPSRREGSFFAPWAAAAMGLNSPVSHLHQGPVPRGLPAGSVGKSPPAVQEMWVCSPGWEDSLEKGMATHSSVLAWRIPWTEEPGGLQSLGSQSQTRLSS